MHNIAIYEGNKAARMQGVSLITTDDGNDGRVTWVPQDDRKTGTLYVHENGTYRAEDEGLHSWSKVTVRLAGAPVGITIPTRPDPIKGIEIPTGEQGEIDPVPPAGWEPLDDIEPISLEEAEKIIEGELDEDSQDYKDAIQEIADRLGTDPENVKVVDPDDPSTVKEAEPKPEGNGQKIEGTDPETGKEKTIGIKKDGTVDVELPIVDMIVVRPPNKRAYHDGDRISFYGMVLGLVDSEGNVKKRIRWPNTKIGTPVTRASIEEAEGVEVSYGAYTIGLTSMVARISTSESSRGNDYIEHLSGLTSCRKKSGRSLVYVVASRTPAESVTDNIEVMPWRRNKDGEKVYDEFRYTTYTRNIFSSYTYAGKTVYYGALNKSVLSTVSMSYNGGHDEAAKELSDKMVAWIMAYGDYKRGVQNVPVTYGDYSDSFDIWVS